MSHQVCLILLLKYQITKSPLTCIRFLCLKIRTRSLSPTPSCVQVNGLKAALKSKLSPSAAGFLKKPWGFSSLKYKTSCSMESTGVGQGFMWPTPEALGAGKTTRRACQPVARWQFSDGCDERELEKSTESWATRNIWILSILFIKAEISGHQWFLALLCRRSPVCSKVCCNAIVSNFNKVSSCLPFLSPLGQVYTIPILIH